MSVPRNSARRQHHRYRYSPTSRSGFIELIHDRFSDVDLQERLLGVKGVTSVTRHRLSKAEQGNISENHAQQHNWKVNNAVGRCFEFEITTNSNFSDTHLQGHGIQRTVSAMFKDAPEGALIEAWRILFEAVGDIALFPEAVMEWISDMTWESGAPQKECVFYKYRDATGLTWYSNADDDTDFFTDVDRAGWIRYVDFLGRYWWHNHARRQSFYEKSGCPVLYKCTV